MKPGDPTFHEDVPILGLEQIDPCDEPVQDERTADFLRRWPKIVRCQIAAQKCNVTAR
jgi:hypothetical protein